MCAEPRGSAIGHIYHGSVVTRGDVGDFRASADLAWATPLGLSGPYSLRDAVQREKPAFEPSAQVIRNRMKQAALDAGQRTDGLTAEEREELRRLRRENRTPREEREVLKRAAAWFARETRTVPSQDSVRDGSPGRPFDRHHVPGPGCLHQRVLRVAQAPAVAPDGSVSPV